MNLAEAPRLANQLANLECELEDLKAALAHERAVHKWTLYFWEADLESAERGELNAGQIESSRKILEDRRSSYGLRTSQSHRS